MEILVVAAHPDDEVIGAGGTIARYAKDGHRVHLCIVTKAYPPEWTEEIIKVKRQEVLKASKILGISEVHFLDLPTVKLDTVPQKQLNEAISRILQLTKPEIVFTTHRGDVNKDHRLVFEATMVAVRPVTGSTIRKVLCYELLSSTEWGSPFVENAFIPNAYVNISDTLDTKLRAMAVYKTELKEYPHPRSLEAISALAAFRGSTIGVKAAEAFILVREIQI